MICIGYHKGDTTNSVQRTLRAIEQASKEAEEATSDAWFRDCVARVRLHQEHLARLQFGIPVYIVP